MTRLRTMAGSTVQSVGQRRFLLGAVLAWVLIVYLVAGPTESSSVPPIVAPAHGGSAAPAPSGLLSLGDLGPQLVAPTDTFPSFEPPGAASFEAPPSPPSEPTLSCPYPLPQAQDPGANPGELLSFLTPPLALGGAFSSYALPTLGAIAPLVPVITPLVVMSQPVLNEVTPDVSSLITDIVEVENDLGLNGPASQQAAQQFEPYWLQLLGSLEPAEQALTSSTAGQCLILFENALAQYSNQLNLSLPPLPLIPAGLPPSSGGASAAAVATGTASMTHAPVAHLSLPWSSGIPAGLGATVGALRAKGMAVAVELVDAPPAGASQGGTGFADFVALVVHQLHAVSMFQVDAASADPVAPGALADVVHGLAAADMTRQPGQLIGLGLPAAVLGTGGPAFWKAFATGMRGYQLSMVDFVAADLTPAGASSPDAAAAGAAATARALEHAWATVGGVPSDIPLFATVDFVGPGGSSAALVRQELGTYLAALAGLHVGLLGMSSS